MDSPGFFPLAGFCTDGDERSHFVTAVLVNNK
jgi:hypothetical protein